jgi:hypothetical protein
MNETEALDYLERVLEHIYDEEDIASENTEVSEAMYTCLIKAYGDARKIVCAALDAIEIAA